MSGDKLLGGPQAGIILGSRAVLERIRNNPLTRSFRVDKLTLAALEATLALYREPERALRDIPALAQLTTTVDTLRKRAEGIRKELGGNAVDVVDSDASVGGGAFPTARIPSVALAVHGSAEMIESKLRAGDPALIARIADGRVLIDLRTIFASDDALVTAAIRAARQ
jgi:L-seryl-tRNA(Ser) seleniumtransferase